MNLIKTAVKRRVTVAMAFLCVVLLGVVSLTGIGLDLFPAMEMPMAMITTTYNGASSEEVETMITEPIENAMGTMENVDSITSESAAGVSIVTVSYNWGTDLDFASLTMREKVDSVRGYLPAGADSPTILRMSMNTMPVMMMIVNGEGNNADLKDLVEDEIRPAIERQAGVASVEVGGGLTQEVSISVEPVVLQNYGLTMDTLVQTIQANNMNMAAGSIINNNRDLTIRVLGKYDTISEIENINIVLPSGISVLLKDIAEVELTESEDAMTVWQNGQDAIYISVSKASDANTVTTCENVTQALADLEAELPEGVVITTFLNQGDIVQMTVDSLVNSLLVGALLAVLILLIFLRSFRSTLVIAISIPISLISTFVLMYFNGMTLNMMTIGGLALGAGMMVDASIVILENIQRLRTQGMSGNEAAVKGASQLVMAVVASTLTTVAVFLPVAFMSGLVSMFFKDMAMTITFALLASLVVAVTLVPMLSAQLLRPEQTREERYGDQKPGLLGRMQYGFGDFFDKTRAKYTRLLDWALDHRKRIILGVTVLFVLAFGSLAFVGMEFVPSSETSQINAILTMQEGISQEEAERLAMASGSIIGEQLGDDMTTIMTTIDGNLATIYVSLPPRDERELSTSHYAELIRQGLAELPGIEYSVAAGEMMSVSMGGGAGDVSVQVSGTDMEVLKEICEQIKLKMAQIPGAREITSSFDDGTPELHLRLDYDKVSSMGLTVPGITAAISTYLDGQTASQYSLDDGSEIDIIVNMTDSSGTTLQDLLNMPVTTATGATLLLSDVADIERGTGPVSISRTNQKRQVAVSCMLVDVDLNTYTLALEESLEDLVLPQGYEIVQGGSYEEMVDAFKSLSLAVVLAIVLVYMVMASLFESFLQPFIILFTIPTALIGVLIGLFVTGSTLNIVTFIGIVMLVGIVVNNGIVMIDYVNTLRSESDMTAKEALLVAGPLRLRPILMTTLTTILAMLPMAFSQSEGAELARGMAVAVAFGLTFSTCFTLVLIPVIYSLIDDFRAKRRRKHAIKKARKKLAKGDISEEEAREMVEKAHSMRNDYQPLKERHAAKREKKAAKKAAKAEKRANPATRSEKKAAKQEQRSALKAERKAAKQEKRAAKKQSDVIVEEGTAEPDTADAFWQDRRATGAASETGSEEGDAAAEIRRENNDENND